MGTVGLSGGFEAGCRLLGQSDGTAGSGMPQSLDCFVTSAVCLIESFEKSGD